MTALDETAYKIAEKIEARLEAEGLAIVPKDPTPEMVRAGLNVSFGAQHWSADVLATVARAYRAMIDARPE